jgi:CspA family cold shock protein
LERPIEGRWFLCPRQAKRFCFSDPLARRTNRKFCQFDDVFDDRHAFALSEFDDSGNFMTNGIVKFFNESKGFGFIAPEDGGKDVFVHATALEAAGIRSLSEGQKVTFESQPDARGAKAVNLKLA